MATKMDVRFGLYSIGGVKSLTGHCECENGESINHGVGGPVYRIEFMRYEITNDSLGNLPLMWYGVFTFRRPLGL